MILSVNSILHRRMLKYFLSNLKSFESRSVANFLCLLYLVQIDITMGNNLGRVWREIEITMVELKHPENVQLPNHPIFTLSHDDKKQAYKSLFFGRSEG